MVSNEVASTNPPNPHVFSQRLQESMRGALMKAMEERDMSHAKLAAAEVLHTHKLEQQRKLNSRLEVELDALRSDVTASNPEQERLQRQMQIQQNSDEELMSLCQQLAGEISARTTAALEVDRLKEASRVDSEQYQSKVRSLEEEIDMLQKELEREKSERTTAVMDGQKWRRCYEDAIAEEDVTPSTT